MSYLIGLHKQKPESTTVVICKLESPGNSSCLSQEVRISDRDSSDVAPVQGWSQKLPGNSLVRVQLEFDVHWETTAITKCSFSGTVCVPGWAPFCFLFLWTFSPRYGATIFRAGHSVWVCSWLTCPLSPETLLMLTQDAFHSFLGVSNTVDS